MTAALAAAPAVAFAQSAGDDQYTDPFGSNTTTATQQGTSTTDMPNLSKQPQGSSRSPASTTPSTQSAEAAPKAATNAEQLPATGLDARVIALAGVAMLLLGAGLRLRLGADPRD
jgi:LPXTG-motif cell wall-anchored protein